MRLKPEIDKMLFKNSKSGSTVDFLMTYGWAILIIFVALGTLIYFKILSIDKVMPERCSISLNIKCLDYNATANGITMTIKNNYPYEIKNLNLTIDECGSKLIIVSLKNSSELNVTAKCGLDQGKKFTKDILVDYIDPKTNISENLKGSITAMVEWLSVNNSSKV